MRISERMRYNVVENRVNQSKDRNAQALERLSSLKDITKLSDDPTGVKQIVRFRERILDKESYRRNIDFASGFLDRSEQAVQGITDNLIRAKELAIAMSNDTYDAQSRDATSREIKEIIEEIVQLGNSSFNGRYVFGGFRNLIHHVLRDEFFIIFIQRIIDAAIGYTADISLISQSEWSETRLEFAFDQVFNREIDGHINLFQHAGQAVAVARVFDIAKMVLIRVNPDNIHAAFFPGFEHACAG